MVSSGCGGVVCWLSCSVWKERGAPKYEGLILNSLSGQDLAGWHWRVLGSSSWRARTGALSLVVQSAWIPLLRYPL